MENIAETRKKILENAKVLLENEGLKGLTIQNLIKKCGIGKTTFYRLFPTKKDLLLQLKHYGNNNHTRIFSHKDQIAEIALKGFIHNGYSGFDMESVAKAAKLNRVTLYRYFSNKDELLAYCMQGEFRKIKKLLSAHMLNNENPEEALKQYINFLNSFLENSRVNSLIAQSWNQIFKNTRIKELAADLNRYFTDTFVGIIEDGKEKGFFKPDLDSSIYARIIIMLQNGFMFTMTYEPEFNDPASTMHTILSMILNEIRK